MLTKQGLFLFFSILVLTGCATVDESPFPSNLPGMIYDDFNNPVDGADITLERTDAPEEQSESEPESEVIFTSDIDGRFLLPNLNPGRYRVTISREDYETQELLFKYNDPMQVLYIKLTSLRFLRQEIENNIDQREWDNAALLLEKADGINPRDPVVNYLRALWLFRQDKPGAEEILLELRNNGIKTGGIDGLLEKIRSRNEG